jgi:hypothetical protein
LAAKEEAAAGLRVPDLAASASSDKERREIITKSWAEQVSKTHLLKQDKPDTFISRKGRKVGVHTAQERDNGSWEFSFPERSLNVLVLLAEDPKGFLSDYVIPPKILQEHWKHRSCWSNQIYRSNSTWATTAHCNSPGPSVEHPGAIS